MTETPIRLRRRNNPNRQHEQRQQRRNIVTPLTHHEQHERENQYPEDDNFIHVLRVPLNRYFRYWQSSGSKGSPNEMVASSSSPTKPVNAQSDRQGIRLLS